MLKKMLVKLFKTGMKMIEQDDVRTAENDELKKVVYNLVANVNQLISISRENQEIMVDLATIQDEILNLMEQELDYQEEQEQTNIMPKSGKINGALN
jgi:hypothetical protein